MAFFRNDAVNRVNLHYGVQALAASAGGTFYAAFLLHAGVPVSIALAAMAAVFGARFALRPAVLPLAKRTGIKPVLIAGALVIACQYLVLGEVRGVGPWLFALVAVQALADILYWPSYHAYFASLGDAEHRGHQIGAREAMAALVGIAGPLVGAWALLTAGPRWTFLAIAVAQAASVLPLIRAPNVAVAAKVPGVLRSGAPGLALFVADGWMGANLFFAWQIALFISLGRSLGAYGGAMALAALVGAALGLVSGRHIDRGHGRRAAVVAYAATAAVALLRAASLGSPWLAVGANALGAVLSALTIPAIMTAVYNLAKASPCAFRSHLAAEAAWDVGGGCGLLAATAITALGGSLAIPLVLTLPGAAGAAWVLWRYYGAGPDAAAPEAIPEIAIQPHLPP